MSKGQYDIDWSDPTPSLQNVLVGKQSTLQRLNTEIQQKSLEAEGIKKEMRAIDAILKALNPTTQGSNLPKENDLDTSSSNKKEEDKDAVRPKPVG